MVATCREFQSHVDLRKTTFGEAGRTMPTARATRLTSFGYDFESRITSIALGGI